MGWLAGDLALGLIVASAWCSRRCSTTTASSTRRSRKEQFPAVHAFLTHKWYFDELYSAIVVRPALVVAHWFRWFDLTSSTA